MSPTPERQLLDKAFERFQTLVEDGGVRVVRDTRTGDGDRDDVWRVETGHLFSEIVVEAFTRISPRDVDRFGSDVARRMRRMGDKPILVVTPWLSPRSRDLLTDYKINYMDQTGNIRVRVPRLPIVVQMDGAQKNPNPPENPRRGLQGRGVNALVRILVDVVPPYRVTDLSRATGLSLAYVSRTLEALHEERLVERGRNRAVVDVDWPRLLHERAASYDLLKTNRGRSYIARTGLPPLRRALRIPEGAMQEATEPGADALYRQFLRHGGDQPLVTGSFAVRDFVQVAAPTQLALYVPDAEEFADRHRLMPADRGANVLLLQAAHQSQLERIRFVDGVFHAGISQLALDCLSGNGRLPEEGEALVEWMRANTQRWRLPHLPETPER